METLVNTFLLALITFALSLGYYAVANKACEVNAGHISTSNTHRRELQRDYDRACSIARISGGVLAGHIALLAVAYYVRIV